MKNVAVIGLGRFGSKIAVTLSQKGFDVIGIDEDDAIVDDVKDLIDQAIVLDSTDEKSMRAVQVDTVDIAVVAIALVATVDVVVADDTNGPDHVVVLLLLLLLLLLLHVLHIYVHVPSWFTKLLISCAAHSQNAFVEAHERCGKRSGANGEAGIVAASATAHEIFKF